MHNLAAERACGKIDYRIKRTHSLPPVNRQMILHMTNKKEKQKRMKLEISYARDTSTLLQKVDPLFKIRKVDLKGKQRDNTATELERRWQSSWAGRQTGGQWTIQHSRIA